ncbi:maleylpyruvate isomerase family mycothiol-dependent enzyme [Serinicoccus kebangsaanensis]|uniref:maleylpyruvate isomerase family mycothiol-dependent enzyme n=1 Tax=Serinicoccus kebangsaanensis TaxID=2602069 RepID=UPI00124D129A|nr:maleylpyruvate isomerase family mycothiol-dependent enzyme [Serinicoccus kebangsaanensis]
MPRPDDEIRAMTTEQRRDTAALLESLSPEQWGQPSGCEGWTIHQLVAHLTLPYTSRLTRVVREVLRARGSFDRAADRMARADARTHTPQELVVILRRNLDHPWSPPGGGPAGALSHDVIHSYDLTDPLGVPPVVTAARATTVLEAFRRPHLKGFGVDLSTTRFEATDADLAVGAEAAVAQQVVTAPLLDLVPLTTGRRLGTDGAGPATVGG